MNKSVLIQYLPLSHPKAALRVVRKLGNNGVKAIIDLEDSVQDPFNAEKTNELKRNARKGFLKLITDEKFDANVFREDIFLRINSRETNYHEEDVQTILKVCETKFPLKGVFLPKVEDFSQISELHDLFHNKGFNLEIVPMIETIKGMNSLESILQSEKSNTIFKYIHYGHFDYALDSDLWPFPDPNHQKFWDIVLYVSKLVTDYNKTYIHTPFPFMNDKNLFWRASHYLENKFPNKELWICTLNSELSLSEDTQEIDLNIIDPEYTEEKCLKEAEFIKSDFINGRANKRSFSVGSNRFIPPHQYFAALNYISKHS